MSAPFLSPRGEGSLWTICTACSASARVEVSCRPQFAYAILVTISPRSLRASRTAATSNSRCSVDLTPISMLSKSMNTAILNLSSIQTSFADAVDIPVPSENITVGVCCKAKLRVSQPGYQCTRPESGAGFSLQRASAGCRLKPAPLLPFNCRRRLVGQIVKYAGYALDLQQLAAHGVQQAGRHRDRLG